MIRRAIVLALALLAVGGCGDDGPLNSTATGAYALRTVNGSALPYTTPGSGTEIIDDVITLFQGGTYAGTAHRRSMVNGQLATQTIETTGTYSFFGTSVTLRVNETGLQRLGTISGTSMTFVESGNTSVYRK
ncbi:MAG: hypothetical protein IT353_07905 [Gemmatimonadaceae bacterium]|nr:hypothetical protein [Gemmatimonadaceae bacterium]